MLTKLSKRLFYQFWSGYQAMIISTGLVLISFSVYALTLSILSAESIPLPYFPGLLVLLLLYVTADAIPLWLRGVPHSPAFVILLLTILFTNGAVGRGETAVATLVAAFGSFTSEIWRNFRSPQAIKFKLIRALFYAAHHAAAISIASWVYFYITITRPSSELLENVHFLAIAACLFIASLLSTALIYPHDWLFDRSLLAEPQDRFPRINLWTSALIVPVPVFLFSLFSPANDFVWITLSALFLIVIYIARTYVQIDVGNRQQKERDEIEKSLGVLHDMDDLLHKVTDLLDRATAYQWAALYHMPDSNDSLFYLRGVMQRGEPAVSYAPLFTGLNHAIPVPTEPPTKEGLNATDKPFFYWLRRLRQDSTILRQLLKNNGVVVDFVHDENQVEVVGELYFPPAITYLCAPIYFESRVTGLLFLVRTQSFFREVERCYAQNVADRLGNKLRQLEQVENSNEQRLQHLFGKIKSSVETRERVERSIQHLTVLGVDIAKVSGEIANHTLQANLIFSLQGHGVQESALPEQTLKLIYQKVRFENPTMPPLTDEIIQHLKVIPDSFALSFSIESALKDLRYDDEHKELHNLLAKATDVQTIDDIINLQAEIALLVDTTRQQRQIDAPVMTHLKGLLRIIKKLKATYSPIIKPEQKQENLVAAFNETKELEKTASVHVANPEKFAFQVLLLYWLNAIAQALNTIHTGVAELDVSLRKNYALPTPAGVTVVLNVQNRGKGAALNLQVQLLQPDNDQYQQLPDTNPVPDPDILLPGRSHEITFTIKPGTTNNLRLSFALTYQDQEKSINEISFADILHLRDKPPRFIPIENPYLAGIPLAENHESFVGREEVFAFISENMNMSLSQHPVVLLIGTRRIGKTSILKQLPTRLGAQNYIHVFLDCQGLVDAGNVSFFLYFAQAITDGLIKAGYDLQSPAFADFQDNPGHVFERLFLPKVWQLTGNRHLLVVVDEYEQLEKRVRDGKLDQNVILYLRSLMQHQQRLAFIFAGTSSLQELASDYWHVFFNIAKMQPISFLSEAAAISLITQPVQNYGMVYDDLAVEEILRGTGRHPYFLQLVCDELVSICNREKRSYVTIAHAQAALRTILDRGRSHLNFIWDRSTPLQRLVLSALAKSLFVDSHTTVDSLMRHLVKAEHEQESRIEVRQALYLLEEQLIVVRHEETGRPPTYDFAATLYYMWIKKHHSLD